MSLRLPTRLLLRICLPIALCLGALGAAHATYPERPIRFVVAYAAGGATDSLARAVSERLASEFKQPVVVDNRAGGGGTIAAEQVARAQPDGHTLLVTDTQYVITPYLIPKLSFDPKKDLVPVTLMASMPVYVAVKTSAGIHSINELVTRARGNPGKLSYGSAGVGSLHHIAMEAFKQSARLHVVHIPYRGSGQSIAGFLAGDVDVLVASMSAIAPHVKAGTVKLLASSGGTRAPQSPDVPSLSEVVPGYDYSTEIGVFAPAGTPRDVIEKLQATVAAVLKSPSLTERVTHSMGGAVVGSTSEAYQRNVQHNLDRYSTVVKASGAKLD
ncbi:Bug family tripartite tricarboxylate transporter substrate binding protein [Ramlibacter sp.]|uniref:Bug family tripartite tricarboxylate transporter substrate binding protein n=1 Tax=Ramlibacter sp. TaxID=1917967 RepID=UPI003D11B09B